MKSSTSVKDASLPFPNEIHGTTNKSNNNLRRLSVYTVPQPDNIQQNNNGTSFTLNNVFHQPSND